MPSNCRWADDQQQHYNKRNTKFATGADGTTRTIAEWSKLSRIPQRGIYARLALGWPESEAVSQKPLRKSTVKGPDGTYRTIAEWAEVSGIKSATIRYRLKAPGWTESDAVSKPPDRGNSSQRGTGRPTRVKKPQSKYRNVTGPDGETRTIAEWAKLKGVSPKLIWERLEADWTQVDAVNVPKRTQKSLTGPDGSTRTVSEWADVYGISSETINQRLRHHWSEADAVSVPTGGKRVRGRY